MKETVIFVDVPVDCIQHEFFVHFCCWAVVGNARSFRFPWYSQSILLSELNGFDVSGFFYLYRHFDLCPHLWSPHIHIPLWSGYSPPALCFLSGYTVVPSQHSRYSNAHPQRPDTSCYNTCWYLLYKHGFSAFYGPGAWYNWQSDTLWETAVFSLQ